VADGFPAARRAHRAAHRVRALAGRARRGAPEEEVLVRGVPRRARRALGPPGPRGRGPPARDELRPRAVVAHQDPAAVRRAGAAPGPRTLEDPAPPRRVRTRTPGSEPASLPGRITDVGRRLDRSSGPS